MKKRSWWWWGEGGGRNLILDKIVKTNGFISKVK